jgi:hypothetical protein
VASENAGKETLNMVNLGDKVKDVVTGLTGIAVAKTHYLQGCARIGVQPQELKDGKPVEASWFDEPQLEVIEVGAINLKTDQSEKPGGPAYLVDPGR